MNAIGQRTGVATSGTAFPAIPSWNWTYDPLGQVIRADSTVTTSDRSYQYDTIGNRQKSADSLTLPATNNYATNSLNQYTSFPSLASVPSYDFDGNMTTGPLPTAPTTNSTLTWDAENRLKSTTVGSTTTTYQYDAQSRRIAKTTGAVTTRYLYDAWNCIAEYSSSLLPTPTSTLQKTRLWGPDLSGSMQGAGGVAGLLSESSSQLPAPGSSYPTYDGNGNISEYLTATGTIAAHFEYDPFGNTVVNTDTANLFNYRFSTKPRDPETGLYYYGYRYYDPMTGRWPNRDPIEEKGGVNLYGFVRNNGVYKVDRLGLACCYPNGQGPPQTYDPEKSCCESGTVTQKVKKGNTDCCPQEVTNQTKAKLECYIEVSNQFLDDLTNAETAYEAVIKAIEDEDSAREKGCETFFSRTNPLYHELVMACKMGYSNAASAMKKVALATLQGLRVGAVAGYYTGIESCKTKFPCAN